MTENLEITGMDGRVYTIIDGRAPYTLLSYDTENGAQFIVVFALLLEKNGFYSWAGTKYFRDNIQSAAAFLDMKGQR